MDARTEELIAIGASCAANCIPCLRFHLDKARKGGVDEAEIGAAVRIGRLVRTGAARTWDKEAVTLLGAAQAAAPRAEGTGVTEG
jgi:AhpD family alkylhydroperoxidase